MFFKELRYNIRILRWIKDSKQMYIKYRCLGMCVAFNLSNFRLKLIKSRVEECIGEYIPEYNRDNFGVKTQDTYWWDIQNRNVRIKAFDKLIDIYKKKLGFIGKFF